MTRAEPMTGAELEQWIADHQHETEPWAAAPELEVVDARTEHAELVAAVDWDGYRACPVCRRPTGRPCVSQSGRVVLGRTDGVETELEHAHVARKRRKGR